jgi:hypothetical protein
MLSWLQNYPVLGKLKDHYCVQTCRLLGSIQSPLNQCNFTLCFSFTPVSAKRFSRVAIHYKTTIHWTPHNVLNGISYVCVCWTDCIKQNKNMNIISVCSFHLQYFSVDLHQICYCQITLKIWGKLIFVHILLKLPLKLKFNFFNTSKMAQDINNCCTHKYRLLEALQPVTEKSLLLARTEQNTR